ncbi:hypothetical protein FKP32DRAFT_1673196 [Trametes sanguinea]|nr:hypothetical protein FKP32DRAFT_1673196 [Trametes sanguinea]
MTALLALLQAFVASVHAYIPAQPTNETNVAQAAGLNISDVSRISLLSYPTNVHNETVSYQLVGALSTGISKGALVHFTEDLIQNGMTDTPWITLISCDTNSTNASLEDDIFTLAQERGAVSILLYSIHSVACYINPEFADPSNFNQAIDVFSTESLTISQAIEQEFQGSAGNSSKYYSYNPTLLNDSASVIETAAEKGSLSQPGYIFATLTAWNATTNVARTGAVAAADAMKEKTVDNVNARYARVPRTIPANSSIPRRSQDIFDVPYALRAARKLALASLNKATGDR